MAWRGAVTAREVGSILGYDITVVRSWNIRGLGERTADHVAVTIGEHPSAIWPEWFEEEHGTDT